MKRNNKVSEIMNSSKDLDYFFEDILELSKNCKYSDCTHTTEPDCSVQKAISEGKLTAERLHDYNRVINEAQYVAQKKNKTKAIDYMGKLKLFR